MAKRWKNEYNKIFENLVDDESDIVGLVAYGLYKLDKRSQIMDLKKRIGKRDPTFAEIENITNILGSERQLKFYTEKSNQLLDTVVDFMNDQQGTNTKRLAKNKKKFMEALLQTLFGWIPKSLRPIIGILAFIGVAYFAFIKFFRGRGDEECTLVTIRGVIDSPKQDKIKCVSIEKITFGEDKSVVSGKFELENLKFAKGEEVTLTVAYNDNSKEYITFPIANYIADENCVIDVGHQKK